jgi:tetratricopeptide (TPR) repeat protein
MSVNIHEEVEDLYDRHLFLDAFRRSADFWQPSSRLESLSLKQLILGGRLAARLGGLRLSRRLLTAARMKDPTHPLVRYFTAGMKRRGWDVFDELRAFEANSDLGGDDPELRGAWYARFALMWAQFQDMARADACLRLAHGLSPRDSWILSCESGVFGFAHRWEEALGAAEQAWEISPGAPFAAYYLANSLIHLGRTEESAQRMATAAENGQSYEVALYACFYLCTLAETLDAGKRPPILDRACAIAETLPLLAPLADREALSQFAAARLDIAALSDDHDGIRMWAERVRSPFHAQFMENLRNNLQGRRFLLPFRRVLQKRDTCLPASMAAVLSAFGIHVDFDTIAAEITYEGTTIWAAAEWLERRGFVARFFAVDPETASVLIRNGIPFILCMESEDGSHAMAVVGLDEAARTLLIHDPASVRTLEVFVDSIGEDEAPTGPEGLVFVPAEKAPVLDRLLPPDRTEVSTAYHVYNKTAERSGLTASRGVIDELEARHPSHPTTHYLRALQLRNEGYTGEALALFQRLLSQYPNSPRIRQNVLYTCHSLENTALTRQVLKNVVERGILPGVQSEQHWRYPPATYVSKYADQLRGSGETRNRARFLLKSALRRSPACAEAWHVQGDLLWSDRATEGMLLSYRIASTLGATNEHHALSYCYALRSAGREKEGLAWLEERVRRRGSNPLAVGRWISWIQTLEDCGHPEEARAACDEALQTHGESAELLAFAVPFLARMAQWEQSGAGLRRLETIGKPALFYEAAVAFHSMRGDLEAASRYSEAWQRESPQSMPARQNCVNLAARRNGRRAAADLAARWSKEHPGHDSLEHLYYYQLASVDSGRAPDALLLRRVRRNAEDGWAWRELAFRRLAEYGESDDLRRKRMHHRIEKLLVQCNRTSPGAAATLCVKALWQEVRGHWSDALTAWLDAVDVDPASYFAYRRAWECCAGMPDTERQTVLEHIEKPFLACVGRLSIARDLIFLIAERFGVAVARDAVARWQSRRPNEPDLIEAAADLLLEYGGSRSDASQALVMLEPATRCFPFHLGLRFSLAHACIRLGNNDRAVEVLDELLRRHPDTTLAYVQLARVKERQGDLERARGLLETAAVIDPLDAGAWIARTGLLVRTGKPAEARALIREGLQRLPEDATWRDSAVRLLQECGDEEGAVEVAREGVQILPRNAYLWYRLADVLNELPRFAAPGEIESSLRHAVCLDGNLFVATDRLAYHLAEQRRFDEAEDLIGRILPRMPDQSPARGRLCWIHRQRGRSDAVEEMAAVVRAAPWFHWGWDFLTHWLVVDARWDLARSLLCPPPPEQRTNTQFRRRRLQVLAASGTPPAELDSEWEELLAEFPEDLPLHLERYDDLRYNNRFKESAVVLRNICRFHPNNTGVLARLVEINAQEDKPHEAMKALLHVWFTEQDGFWWETKYAWDAVRSARLDASAFAKARQRLADGSRPTLPALASMAKYAARFEPSRIGIPLPFYRTLFPGRAARELLDLIELADRAPWADGRFRAVLFRQLAELGYQRLVVRYWRKYPANVKADVDSWSSVGVCLKELNHSEAARRFLAGWRAYPGVEMWVVANYVQCFVRRKNADYRQVLSECRDALAGLRHDHSARYLAHVQAEMCAVLGDSDAFRQTWIRHKAYFTGEPLKQEWFENARLHLLSAVPRLGSLLDKGSTEEFRQGCRQLAGRLNAVPSRPPTPSVRTAGMPWWWWIPIIIALSNILSRLNER